MKSVFIQRIVIFLLAATFFVCCEEERVEPTSPEEQVEPELPGDSTSISPDSVGLPDEDVDINPEPDTANAPEQPSPSTDDEYDYAAFENLPYRILLPRNYNPSNKYPLLIFLHGKGERGTDNEKQLTFGASLFQSDTIRSRYNAIVVFPQCPVDYYWFDKWGVNAIGKFVTHLKGQYSVDANRLLIGGLSMGAYGTFAIVAQYPDTFVRAVAIAGDGDHESVGKMKKTKWRIFAGEKDEIVPIGKTRGIANALKQAGASVDFKVYPNADHLNSWMNAFGEPDFCRWLFTEHRSHGK